MVMRESQNVVVRNQIKQPIHVNFLAHASGDCSVAFRRLQGSFVLECKPALPNICANRHNCVVVLCKSERGELILRTDLHRSHPAHEQPGAQRAEMDLVQSDGMQHISVRLSMSVRPHPTRQYSPMLCSSVAAVLATEYTASPVPAMSVCRSTSPRSTNLLTLQWNELRLRS